MMCCGRTIPCYSMFIKKSCLISASFFRLSFFLITYVVSNMIVHIRYICTYKYIYGRNYKCQKEMSAYFSYEDKITLTGCLNRQYFLFISEDNFMLKSENFRLLTSKYWETSSPELRKTLNFLTKFLNQAIFPAATMMTTKRARYTVYLQTRQQMFRLTT